MFQNTAFGEEVSILREEALNFACILEDTYTAYDIIENQLKEREEDCLWGN